MSDRTLQECVDQYTQLIRFSTQTKRRWQWIAAISGAAGLSIGASLAVALRKRR